MASESARSGSGQQGGTNSPDGALWLGSAATRRGLVVLVDHPRHNTFELTSLRRTTADTGARSLGLMRISLLSSKHVSSETRAKAWVSDGDESPW